MKKILISVISILSFSFLTGGLEAQVNIPVIGADETISQYVCVTLPGVQTFGIKVILANGTIEDISVEKAKNQIAKQISGLTKKILNVSELLSNTDSKKKREKLTAKIKSLRSQRELLKFIKSQIVLCEKAELEFNASNIPVLLTNTVSISGFAHPVNLFMYGFKFTIPNNYKDTRYCVAVSNATSTPFGGIIYADTGETETTVYKNCQPFGAPVGNLCVNGLEDDEGMIILTQGAIEENQGDCTSTFQCSLNELRSYLPEFYTDTLLTYFRPGPCS